jgi:hypothetical protein
MMFAISTKLTLFDIHADFGIYYFKISEPRAQSLELKESGSLISVVEKR